MTLSVKTHTQHVSTGNHLAAKSICYLVCNFRTKIQRYTGSLLNPFIYDTKLIKEWKGVNVTLCFNRLSCDTINKVFTINFNPTVPVICWNQINNQKESIGKRMESFIHATRNLGMKRGSKFKMGKTLLAVKKHFKTKPKEVPF